MSVKETLLSFRNKISKLTISKKRTLSNQSDGISPCVHYDTSTNDSTPLSAPDNDSHSHSISISKHQKASSCDLTNDHIKTHSILGDEYKPFSDDQKVHEIVKPKRLSVKAVDEGIPTSWFIVTNNRIIPCKYKTELKSMHTKKTFIINLYDGDTVTIATTGPLLDSEKAMNVELAMGPTNVVSLISYLSISRKTDGDKYLDEYLKKDQNTLDYYVEHGHYIMIGFDKTKMTLNEFKDRFTINNLISDNLKATSWFAVDNESVFPYTSMPIIKKHYVHEKFTVDYGERKYNVTIYCTGKLTNHLADTTSMWALVPSNVVSVISGIDYYVEFGHSIIVCFDELSISANEFKKKFTQYHKIL